MACLQCVWLVESRYHGRSLLDDTLGPRRDGCHLDDERNISVGVDAVSTDHTSVSVDRDAERRADRYGVGEGLLLLRWCDEVEKPAGVNVHRLCLHIRSTAANG